MQHLFRKFKWRQFRPLTQKTFSDKTAFEKNSVYAQAREIVDATLKSSKSHKLTRDKLKRISYSVNALSDRHLYDPAHLMAKVILQTPGAARAQHAMDVHRGGYADHRARLFELIDFNDAYVDLVLHMPEEELEKGEFCDRLYAEMEAFCERMNLDMYTAEQYRAISQGLGREIALYKAAKREGFIAHMTSRLQDAKGVDMTITDPDTKRTINIDCKTNSAYHFRLLDLQHQKRISEEDRLRAELMGFILVHNGHGKETVETVLFRMAEEDFGELRNFMFERTDKIASQLKNATQTYGRYIV